MRGLCEGKRRTFPIDDTEGSPVVVAKIEFREIAVQVLLFAVLLPLRPRLECVSASRDAMQQFSRVPHQRPELLSLFDRGPGIETVLDGVSISQRGPRPLSAAMHPTARPAVDRRRAAGFSRHGFERITGITVACGRVFAGEKAHAGASPSMEGASKGSTRHQSVGRN